MISFELELDYLFKHLNTVTFRGIGVTTQEFGGGGTIHLITLCWTGIVDP